MTHSRETRFARDPSAAAEVLQRDRLGCVGCQNSRADHQDAYCLPARNIGKPVSRVPFPHSGQGCPHFFARKDKS